MYQNITDNYPTAPDRVGGVVFLFGFATQKFVQLLDPIIFIFAKKLADCPWLAASLPTTVDVTIYKSFLTGWISFLIAFLFVVTGTLKVSLLTFLSTNIAHASPWLDNFITALVIASGVEFSNSSVKYLQYIKDAKGVEAQATLSIAPSALKVKPSASIQFYASFLGFTTNEVEWEAIGGQFNTINKGLYIAPDKAGIYQIIARSTKYGKTATTTVEVLPA